MPLDMPGQTNVHGIQRKDSKVWTRRRQLDPHQGEVANNGISCLT
jgi:hypothetical protein